ncbi:MAG: TIGR02530 family flagellar biosynthesis protein [Calditrichia bacterium]
MAKIEGIRPPFVPPGGLEPTPRKQEILTPAGKPFADLLQEKIDELQDVDVKFSAHAQSRMISRNIELSSKDLQQLSDAINRAGEKGAKESLILLKDTAFIVNVNNRTVVTAVDGENLEENVFTNIDSAVIVKKEEEENNFWL